VNENGGTIPEAAEARPRAASAMDTSPAKGRAPHSFLRTVLADARIAAAYRGERSEFGSRLDGCLQALRLMLQTDAFLGLAAYRLKTSLHARGIPVLPWIAHRLAIMFGQISIADTVVVHPGVLIPNGQVVVYGEVEIQPTVTLHPWVTVAPIPGGTIGPTIGWGAQIGIGARVLGEIEVGRGARVGVNAVVLDDVEADTTVVGIPARSVAD
jgi:serine O-acetyltransferase